MRHLFSVFVFLILMHCSCRELANEDFPEFSPAPTVNSILIAGKPLKVHVSLAAKLDTNQLTLVNNADVSLFTDGSYAENLVLAENGIYLPSTLAEPLKTYSLAVKIPGYETIICNDILPSPSPIFNIIHSNNAGKDEEGMIYPSVTFSFTTHPTERQYFEVVIRTLQTRYERTATLEKITDPVLLNEGLPLTIFSNEIIRDSVYTMTINYFTGAATLGSNMPYQTRLFPLIIELRSCSYNYYSFVKQKYLYEKGRYPEFMAASSTVCQLFSNISGGYGIFAGYSVAVSDTIYPDN